MKFYLAGRLSRRLILRNHAEQLEALGHKVVSEWVFSNEDVDSMDLYDLQHRAIRDYRDLHEAECLILDVTDSLIDSSGGGREWEGGHATARNLTVVLIGKPRHVFHYLIPIRFENWEKLIDILTNSGGAFIWYLVNRG